MKSIGARNWLALLSDPIVRKASRAAPSQNEIDIDIASGE
jgi:hypothetical protein